VTYLILTGGHSRWYFVDQTLQRVFPHLSGKDRTLLRHSRPEQSVARGLAYDPLIRSNQRGILAPQRRAAHALWVSVPNGAFSGAAAATLAGGKGSGWDEPMLLIPRGQSLPFQTRAPLRIRVEQLGLNSEHANVRIRFFSGQQRTPLVEREATFERGFWEKVTKKVSLHLPWVKATGTDQFEVLVACQVDEHELITAELLVTRYLQGKAMEVQRQKMKLGAGVA
jgi:hypothetical protein